MNNHSKKKYQLNLQEVKKSKVYQKIEKFYNYFQILKDRISKKLYEQTNE